MAKDGCWSTQNQYFLAESSSTAICGGLVYVFHVRIPLRAQKSMSIFFSCRPHHHFSQTSIYDTKTSSHFFNELLYKCWLFYEHRRPSWLVMPAMCNMYRKIFYFVLEDVPRSTPGNSCLSVTFCCCFLENWVFLSFNFLNVQFIKTYVAVCAEAWVISLRIEIYIPTIYDRSFKAVAETYHI